jgi:hypothetical protein
MTEDTRVRIGLSIGLLLVAFLISGCGPGRPRTVPVRGTVMYQGKPVPNGTVMFVPQSGQEATGEIQPDGSYSLTTFVPNDGAVPGNYTVVIVAREDTSKRLPEDRNPLPPPIIPMRFTSIATSPLRAEVKDQENVLEFVLERDK